MTILDINSEFAKFDAGGRCQLGEDAEEDGGWIMELQRKVIRKCDGGAVSRVMYRLMVSCGRSSDMDRWDDATFYGMSANELRRLGELLIKLSQEPIT